MNETDKSWNCASCGSLNASWLETCGGCDSDNPSLIVDTVFTLNTSTTTDTMNWGEGKETFGIQQPVYEGRYQIGDGSLNVSFSIGKKPHYIHRWFCKWCLGWKWIDN
jgi:hypothetical protein